MTTIRRELEAIRLELVNPNNHEHLRLLVMEHAERALAILNQADRFNDGFPEPPSNDDVLICDPQGES